jgi:WD40 repeat protein
VSDRGQHRGELRAVPDAPSHYLPREDAIAVVQRMVLEGAGGKVGISAVGERKGPLGVYGLGGIGKTVLAAAVARSSAIKERFPDGVLWLTVGQEPELTRLQAQVAREFGDDEVFTSAGQGHRRLRELLAERAMLLVLDDVWDVEHASKLDMVGERGRLLMTTRNREVLTALGASEYRLDVLPMDQACALLARWAGCEIAALPEEAEHVARLCGCLPLALAMIGAMVREDADWRDVREAVEQADIEEIAHRVQDYPYEDVLRAMEVSVHALASELRERYLDLAVFGEDESIPASALAVLWGMSERKARSTLSKLAARSLVIRDDSSQMHLHDLQRMYVRARAVNLAARHGALVDAYAKKCPDGLARGPAGTVDVYFFGRLPVHLLAAGREPELRKLLLSYDWMDAKLRAAGAAELIADFERVECDTELALVRDALRLSSHVVGKDAAQLPTQLIGRLGYFEAEQPRIRAFLDQVRTRPRHTWLCPVRPTLTPPGGPLVRMFAGHANRVNAVALSAEGKRALSGSDDGTVKLWNVDSGDELRTFEGHMGRRSAVNAVALSAEGKRALSGSRDGTVKLWDVDSGDKLRTFKGHGRGVTAVALSAEGKRALSGSWDGTVKLWDVDSGDELGTFNGHGGAVNAVAVSADNKRAVSGSDDETVKLWDVDSGKELRTFKGHGRGVTAVALSADGKRVLSGSRDRTVKLWDVDSGEELCTFEGHRDAVQAVALSADGRHALSGSHDRTVRLWDVDNGEALRVFEGHGKGVWAVAVSADGKRALSGSDDCTLRLWEVDSYEELRTFEGHGRGVTAVAVGAEGKRALSGSDDCTVKLWEMESGAELRTFEGHVHRIVEVAVSTDGKGVLSGSHDGTVKLWDVDSGDELHTFNGLVNESIRVAVSADGKRVLSRSWDGTVKLWDVDIGKEPRTFEGHGDGVRAVTLSADGKRPLSRSWDGAVMLWDVDSGKEVRTFEGHGDGVRAVTLSADGKRALSRLWDGTVIMWDVDSGTELHTFEGRGDGVTAVVLSADFKRALQCSGDGTVTLWDVDSGTELHTFEGDGDGVTAVALSADFKRAVSGSDGGTVMLWDVDSGKEVRIFEGHGDAVRAVTLSADGKRALSRSWGRTVLWDADSGNGLRTFVGHGYWVNAVAQSADGKRALQCSGDGTVKMWEVDTGQTILTFTNDTSILTYALSDTHPVSIIIGDRTGGVHLFRLIEPAEDLDLQAESQPSGSLDAVSARGELATPGLNRQYEVTSMPMPTMELEARLARLLGEMFAAEELRAFMRHHVSKELADDLPTPGRVAKSLYMAEAAEKLVGRGLVAPAFIEAWAAERPGRAAEIRALLSGDTAAGPAANPAPVSAHPSPQPAPQSVTNIHIHSMTNSALHTGTGSQTVTTSISNAAAPSTRDEAIAQLREEVLAIQDQLVHSHKLHIDAHEQREQIVALLLRIIEKVESRLEGAYSTQALKEATTQAIMEINAEQDFDRDLLRRVAHSGIAQGLLSSSIMEMIKFLFG